MFLAAASTLALLLPTAADGEDWPHLRGPDLNGRAPGRLGDGPFGLRPVWTSPVGSAYSGVAVAQGFVVTLGSDGETDFVLALDAADGKERWRSPFGPVYLGHDGSEDGPISSPVVGHGLVYAIGPRGKLLALDVVSGETRWSHDLTADFGAPAPEYGFTTTPLIEGELVIVQAGGTEGRSLCAFDALTGEVRWTSGDGEVGYQSPVAMDLAGRRMLVALGGNELYAVAPESGERLWTHALGERDRAGTGLATPVDGEHFFATVSGAIAMYHVAWGELPVEPVAEGEAAPEPTLGYVVTELYRSRDMGNSYASPVHHEGHLYGYRGDILSCIDAATGARVWRSRPPGGEGVILVDGRLFAFGANGAVVVADATPEGYAEVARTQALEQSSYTWPSYANGRVYVRNHDRLACVEVVDGAPAAVEAVASGETGGSFARFVAEVRAADDKTARIEAWMAEQDRFPVIADGRAHFVFRGEVEDVVLVGSMVDGSRADPLERIEGTDFYFRSYPIEDVMRWEYRFQVDYGEWRTDPLNPRVVAGDWGGELSELVTAGYELETHAQEPDGEARGRVEEVEFTSEQLDNTRILKVYLPHGYDEGEESYPLLLVHRGDDWLEKGELVNTLDNLIGARVRPLVAVFVPPIRQWWYEGGGTGTDVYIDMLATELVPHLESLYRLSADPGERAVMGNRSFGMTAAYATLRHPEVFGLAAMQSLALNDVTRHEFLRELEEGPRRDTRYYLDWNLYERRDSDRGFDFAVDSRRVWDVLEARGYPVTGGEALDGHGWGSWKHRVDDLLEALFPLE